MSDVISESESASIQEARAQLRESFLKAITELQGEPCQILTYENSTLEATFSGWRPDGSDILVKNLKTPANVALPSSLLRTPDILTISFNKQLDLTTYSST